MAFGLGKLAVLESKLDIYEDLSKEMLDKLERAVTSISDNSNKIAIVLERHENRFCLLYTSPSPRDLSTSRMPSSA